MNEYDAAVIGGGAAGLSAALVLSRARPVARLVVDDDRLAGVELDTGQVVTAAGEGSAAAIAINNHLAEEDTATAGADYRAVRPT